MLPQSPSTISEAYEVHGMSNNDEGHDCDASSTLDKPGAADIVEMVDDTIQNVPGGS